jgi:GT2 family glycosyltransferase
MLPAPGFLIHKEVFEKTNGFNENFGLLDDYPFMLSVSKAGYRFFHIKDVLIFYRLHDKSISTDQKINHRYYNDIKMFFKTFYLKELRINKLYVHYMHYLFQYILLILVSKKIIKDNRTYMNFLSWGSALHWKLRIQNQIGKISF